MCKQSIKANWSGGIGLTRNPQWLHVNESFSLEPVFFSYLRGMKHCLGTFGPTVPVCREMRGNLYWLVSFLNVTVGFGNRCMNNTTQFVFPFFHSCCCFLYSCSSTPLFLPPLLPPLIHLTCSLMPDLLSAVFLCLHSSFCLWACFPVSVLFMWLCGNQLPPPPLQDHLICHRKHHCLSPFLLSLHVLLFRLSESCTLFCSHSVWHL